MKSSPTSTRDAIEFTAELLRNAQRAVVLTGAGLPMQALDHGAHLIILNNSFTYLDVRADSVLQGDVADMLPAIAEQV
jgi:NAD-dependent SIR2 family protein deacetylase